MRISHNLSVINGNWATQKEIKISVFCLKSVINLSWPNIEEMQGTFYFLPFKNLFKINQ